MQASGAKKENGESYQLSDFMPEKEEDSAISNVPEVTHLYMRRMTKALGGKTIHNYS